MQESLNRLQGFTLKIRFYKHQQQALQETEGQNKVAYYLDMGLGKTFVGAEKMVRMGKGDRKDLLVCQKSKIQDWRSHFADYYKYDISAYDLTKKKEWDDFWNNPCGFRHQVGIINYELAWRRKDLLNLENFTLMLDESSLIQNTSAKQTKFILQLNPSNVILLSGTPVGGKYENLWSQLHLLGWNISEKMYKNQYVNWKQIDAGGFKHWIVDKDDPYKNTDRLKRKMREHGAVFMKTEEVFDLPEQIFTKVKVDKSKWYSTFMKDCIVQVDDETELVGDTTLTKMLYARQLCGHYNQDKLSAFRDLIQSTEDRLIVFYSFNAELDALKTICKECDKPVSEVNGHTKDLTAYEQESNSVTLVQYQAGSKGLNLQMCNRIIYFTLPLSSEDFEQSKKRIHRIGQEQTCFYYLMICKGSIEERILKTLEERKDFTDELFEDC